MALLSQRRIRPDLTWLLAALVAVLAGALYLRTLQPTLGGMFNSEEYQQAAYAMGLAHSTGYPLYLLLGKIFITLVPVGDPAYRMNLLSAVWASGAGVLVFFIVLQLASSRAAAVLGALLFVTNEAVWRYASVAEVDTLTAFLAAFVFLSLLLWRAGRSPLELCAVLYGLCLAHHRTSIFYAPGILLFVFLTRREVWQDKVLVARLAILTFLPLLAYLYVPLRAHTAPDYVATPQLLFNYVVGIPTVTSSQSSYPMSEWPRQADLILRYYLWRWFAGIGIVIAAIGYIGFPHSKLPEVNKATRWLLLPPLVVLTIFSIPPRAPDIDRYLMLPIMVISIGFGLGVARLFQWLTHIVPGGRLVRVAQLTLFALLFLLPLLAVKDNLPNVDYSQNDDAYRLWTEILDLPIEENAVIIGNWSESNALLYMQRVEGRRTDLKVASIFPTEQDVIERVQEQADNAVLYLAPGSPGAGAEYHYTALGPLLKVTSGPVTSASPAPTPASIAMDGLKLVGYGLNKSLAPGPVQRSVQLPPGESARLTLEWQVENRPDSEYDVRLRLLDKAGRNLWQRVEPPMRGIYPMSRWSKGSFVTDSQLAYIPPGTPPGEYQIEVAWVSAEDGKPIGATAKLEGLEVIRSPVPLGEQVFVQQRASTLFPSLELLGYSGGRNAEKPGNDLNLAIAWRALGAQSGDYALRLTLIDPQGDALTPVPMPLLADFPTSRWQRDDAFKAYYTLPLPQDAQPGEWTLRLAVLDETGKALPITSTQQAETTLFQFEVQQ